MPNLIVIAPAWPGIDGGYGIAIRASLLLYLNCFSKIHFICISENSFINADEWPSDRIKWTHLPINYRPLWLRFLISLPSSFPAITMRYVSVIREVRSAIRNDLILCSDNNYLIFEDIPTACFSMSIKNEFPCLTLGIRSHDVTIKAYGPLSHVGNPLSRLAWLYEAWKIQRFEKLVCRTVDSVWAISIADADEYLRRLAVKVDGVISVCLDVERYLCVPLGHKKTVVNIGTADLRKSAGLLSFIQNVWFLVREQVPEARLILAGRGTERFADQSLGIMALGFVEDDREVLKSGLIFINPQEIGSGVQLKSIVAMLAGKVLVSTPIGAEGINGVDGHHFMVAESSKKMVAIIVELMRNSDSATIFSRNARELATRSYSISSFLQEARPLLVDFLSKKNIPN